MISRTKNRAARNKRESKKCRNRGAQRKLLLEPLEDRRLLAGYDWDGAGTLLITLAANEDLTIAEAGGNRTFVIDGTFTATNIQEPTGEGTNTLTFDGSENIGLSVVVDNTGAGAGTNNVTFAGGTLTIDQVVVAAMEMGTTSAINVTGPMTFSGDVTLMGTDDITVNAAIDPATVALLSDDDVLVNAPVSATVAITIMSGQDGVDGDVTFAGAGDLTCGGGVSVMSGPGAITMANDTVITAGGPIALDAGMDVTLGLLSTTDNGSALNSEAVSVVSNVGAIVDAGAGLNVSAPIGWLRTESAAGTGTEADPLEIVVDTLYAVNGQDGDLSFWTSAKINIEEAHQWSLGGIFITADVPGALPTVPVITVSGQVAKEEASPGPVKLVAMGEWASIRLDGEVHNNQGNLFLWADHDIIGDVGAWVTVLSTGEIQIYADHDHSGHPLNDDDGTIQFGAGFNMNAGFDAILSFWLGDCDGFVDSGIETAARVNKGGAGVLRLNGTNNYVGDTHINQGALLINGSLTNTGNTTSPGDIYVHNTGLLGGTGVIQDASGAPLNVEPTPGERDVIVYGGGTVDPGDIQVVDPQTCVHLPGQLEIWGDMDFQAGSTLAVQLDGLPPGDGYGFHDQLVVYGTVDFSGSSVGDGGANLVGEIMPGYRPPVGTRWEIVENDVPDPADLITTRFQDIPELGFAVFSSSLGDRLVNVSYMDDLQEVFDNDVVLTAPGRYDFNGFYGYTQFDLPYEVYQGLSPFQTHTGDAIEGWVTDAPYDLPWYFERNWPEPPPYSSADGQLGRLLYDGQSTDSMGNPVVFEVEVYAPHVGCALEPLAAQEYEVMILTGDTLWNHDGEQFRVTGSGGSGGFAGETQSVNTWGAGASDGSGVVPNWGGGEANPTAGYYRWIRASTAAIVLDDPTNCASRAMLRITISERDLADFDPFAVILGMDIRPVKSVGEITIDPPDAGTDPLSADGVTVDTYTGSGAPPNATLTVTVTAGLPSAVQYAKVNPGDTSDDEKFFGGQIVSDDLGNFTFRVQRPAALTTNAPQEDWTILVEQSSGLSRGTSTQTYTKPQMEPLRFDFGVLGSPLQTYVSGAVTKSFLQVVPQTIWNATRGYGWMSRVAGVDRKDTVSPESSSPLRRDLNYAKNATFKVNLPDGEYSVRIYHSNPKYNGKVPYIADQIQVIAEPGEAGQVTQPTIDSIAPGTTTIQEFRVTVSNGALELRFNDLGGRDGNFVVSGIDISTAGTLPGDMPLRAAGDPQDGGAAAITVADLRPVVAEAAARWAATGLTPAQTATLANVQFAVADLGGAYLGLASPATNQIRIDDDAAMIGWSVVRGPWSVADYRSPVPGIDLLATVMHEMGHLLGHEHSADGLMAPVLSASPSRIPELASGVPDLVFGIPDLASRIPDLASRSDGVFAHLESSDEASSPLLESRATDVLAAATLKSSDEAGQARVPRRNPQRYERELDKVFSELAAEEAS